VIELRLKNAATEMAQVERFDYVIINDLFERALADLHTVVQSQRLKLTSQRRARPNIFKALNLT